MDEIYIYWMKKAVLFGKETGITEEDPRHDVDSDVKAQPNYGIKESDNPDTRVVWLESVRIRYKILAPMLADQDKDCFSRKF